MSRNEFSHFILLANSDSDGESCTTHPSVRVGSLTGFLAGDVVFKLVLSLMQVIVTEKRHHNCLGLHSRPINDPLP